MNFCLNFPLFLIVLSLISSVISSILRGKAARIVTMVLSLASVVMNAVLLAYTYETGSTYTYLMGHYPRPWGNELRIGPMEALFSALFSLILFLCILGGKAQIENRIKEGKHPYFYVMTDLIQSSLLVLVYTNDIFTGYVFIEICTLSSCGILMIRENGRTILAAIRYMIFSLIGSGLFLFGVIFLYNITGQLLMPSLKEAVKELWTTGEYRLPLLAAMCLITIGLSVKSGLFPFHLWMADTYGAAIPPASGILSGLISKGYIFFLLKIIFNVFSTEVFYVSGVQNVLFVMGALGILIGSVSALREDQLFRMIAYSSAAQIGYIYMGIGMSATLGMEAAFFQILTHALTKPALFLASANLSASMGEKKKFRNLQGAGYANRYAGIMFTFGALSMIGLPLTMGFISKFLFGYAAFESTHRKMIPTLLVLAVSTVLNTMYFARTILRLYTKPRGAITRTGPGREKVYAAAALLFLLLNLGFGIFARPFISVLSDLLLLF